MNPIMLYATYAKSVPKFLCLFFAVLMLTGCAGNKVNKEAELQNRIADLESENSALKTEISILKKAFAQAKIDEFTNALKKGADQEPQTAQSRVATATTTSANTLPNNTVAPIDDTKTSAPLFTDLSETPTKDMIEDLAKLHVFDDIGSQFKPDQVISRGKYVEWLFKAHNVLMPPAKQLRFAADVGQQYKDTPPSHPKYKYVQALSNAGYSIGYKDGTFKPDKPLTREEMLGIKVGVDVGKDVPPWRSQMETVWKFSDSKQVDERFTGYINQDYYVSGPHGSNIHRAFGKIGTFRPKQAVKRYEAAATLWQIGQHGDSQNTNAASVLRQKT